MKIAFILIIILNVCMWGIFYTDYKQNARLNKLEKASTCAQQPQRRYYFKQVSFNVDSVFIDTVIAYPTPKVKSIGIYYYK